MPIKKYDFNIGWLLDLYSQAGVCSTASTHLCDGCNTLQVVRHTANNIGARSTAKETVNTH